jgi:hypothetical protein
MSNSEILKPKFLLLAFTRDNPLRASGVRATKGFVHTSDLQLPKCRNDLDGLTVTINGPYWILPLEG